MKLFPQLIFGAFVVLSLSECRNTPAPPAAKPLTATLQEYSNKKCLNDSLCAEINMQFPVLSGGNDSMMVRRMNDSIQIAVYLAANADPRFPLKTALDSATEQLYNVLKNDVEGGFNLGVSYSFDLKSTVLLQSTDLLSVQMDGSSFSGGAHGYYYTILNSFDLNTSASITLDQVVSDTNALRPILEAAFVEANREKGAGDRLEDLLLDPEQPLALPTSFCILPEGVRIVYNPYEVSAYALGQTDFVLSWEKLGALADRKKWLE